MKNKKILSLVMAGIIFAAVLLLDLLTKGLIIPNRIPNVGDSMEVIPGFINFIYIQNRGGAWGILSNNTIFLTIMSVIIIGLFLTFYFLRVRRTGEKSSMWLSVSAGLITGGCLGNMIDRIVFGYVRDFINFQFMSFPVFNFADVALTVGVITMVIYFLFFYSKEEKDFKKDENIMKNNKKDDKNG